MEHLILENGRLSHDYSTLGALFLLFDNEVLDFWDLLGDGNGFW